MDNPALIAMIVSVVIVVISLVMLFISRIKKCPSDRILVKYGSVGKNSDGTKKSAVCIHGGATFVVPFWQAYKYLDLTPISLSVDLKNALSRQNIRIDVPSRFTVGISTEPGVMQNAAERLLALNLVDIQELSKDIIFGQLRLIIATMDIEEINTDREKFLESVSRNVETELKKIGLKLINVNVTDINDESGYIEALGKEAAARAVNDAKKSVAEKTRDGSIGEAEALQDQRIRVADANALAVAGENKAIGDIAKSDATRREIEAEASRRALAAEKIAAAKALEESYEAEKKAELARAAREKATLEADVLVKAEIQKQNQIIQAEALAEEKRRLARGEADATYAKLEAEARGQLEILSKQAQGLKEIVASANNSPESAIQLLIADKLETLVGIQVEAIKNIKFDKITVWDSGSGSGESSTANFASNLMKSIPPLNELFNMAGMNMPKFLGTPIDNEEASEAPKPTKKAKSTTSS